MRHQLLREWNDTRTPASPDSTLDQRIADRVRRTPDMPAVVDGDRQLDYGELDRRANRMAHRLRALGVGPEVPVGILLERSAEMVVAMLAVLKAGGIYLPLDPAYPRERLRYIAEDSATAVVTAGRPVVERLRGLAQEAEATLFMVLVAAFQVLLRRYTGERDVVVGTPVAGRNRAETEGLIGLFLNTVVLRS
ncbi:MAG: AMP-binding protein, partial [bacterium]|nr:AMP-binding protein [bacterium]